MANHSLRRSGLSLLLVFACAAPLTGCSASDETSPAAAASQQDEALILHRYFDENPDVLPEHHAWHTTHLRGEPNYGQSFLRFHHAYIGRFMDWRLANGYGPLPAWNPATPIPNNVRHAGRLTDDPSAKDPLCAPPSWLTARGGSEREPSCGASALGEFVSENQLGSAIDSLFGIRWHQRVHDAVGGDLADPHKVPLDPIFWQFHQFIDQTWSDWQLIHPPAAQD